MNNRSFRLSPRRLSQQQQQQQPLLSSNTNGGNSSSGWIKTSESHEFFLTDPVPLPPVLTPQAEESFRFMDRNVRENRSFKTSSNTNNSTRRLLSKMFLRKQAAKNSSDSYSYSYSTISSTTHSPLQSKATAAAAGLQVPGSSRFNINNDNHNSSNSSKTHSHSHSHTNSTTLDLSRDATRVLRRSKHMQMSRQQSAPDLVGSVLVLSKRIVNSDAATSTIAAAAAATIADTAEKGYQQHGLNNGIGEDEDQTADVPLHNNAPSPRRASCVAATTTTTTTSPRRRGLQLQPRKWQQFSQSFLTGTPLSPSSVTATTEMTANAIEKTTLTRNDDSCHCEPGLVCMAAADDNDNNKNENMHQTDPSLSPFSPTSTRRLLSFDGLVESFDGLVEKASVSSLQQQPSVEMACSGALDDEVEDKETPVQHSSVSTDRDSPWRCVPCFFCTNTLYCADDADDADDYLLFCSECHGASPVRVDGVVVTPTQTPSTC